MSAFLPALKGACNETARACGERIGAAV